MPHLDLCQSCCSRFPSPGASQRNTCRSCLALLAMSGWNGMPVSLVHQLVNHADDCQSTYATVNRRRLRSIANSICWQSSTTTKWWASLYFVLPSSYSSLLQPCSEELEVLGLWTLCPCSSELWEAEIYQVCLKKITSKFPIKQTQSSNVSTSYIFAQQCTLNASVYATDLPQLQPPLPLPIPASSFLLWCSDVAVTWPCTSRPCPTGPCEAAISKWNEVGFKFQTTSSCPDTSKAISRHYHTTTLCIKCTFNFLFLSSALMPVCFTITMHLLMLMVDWEVKARKNKNSVLIV